ncbi:unnamed protein product, partial [Ascophyllum nodosum]
ALGITIFVRCVIDSRGYLPFVRMIAAVMPWMAVAVRGLREGGPFRVAAATRRVVAAARTRGCRYQKKPTAPVGEGRQPRPGALVPIHDPLGWRTRAPRGRVGRGCLGQ